MLASVYIYGGYDAFRNPESKVPKADAVVSRVPDYVPGITSTADLVRLDGAAKVIGGVALALGILPRAAALGLAASLIPTTIAGHPYWGETDPVVRKTQQLHFVKNLAILGGTLLAVVDRD
jgi:putative oxidoreductase